MAINSKAAINTAVLIAGGVWFGLRDVAKHQAIAPTAADSDVSSLDAEMAASNKKIGDAHAEWIANLTPYEVCGQKVASMQTQALPGTGTVGYTECGNLHGAPIAAIQAYELKIHPLPLPNCWDNMGAMDRAKNPDAQKLWDACMTIQAGNQKRAAAAYTADQQKLASEQAMHKKPQDDSNAIIPNL